MSEDNLAAPILTEVVGQPVSGGHIEVAGTAQSGLSSIPTISFSGTVTLYDADTVVGTGTVDRSGNFDIETASTFEDGLYDLKAVETGNGLTSPASTGLLVPIGTQAQIELYYSQILQRTASSAEVNAWVTAETSGQLTYSQILSDIVNSPEAVEFVDPIIRLYEVALGRIPDQAGLQGWENALASGAITEAQIAQAIVNSPEFLADHGGTNQVTATFVAGLYQTALGRQGSAAEIHSWVNSGQTAAQILRGFSDSAQFVHDTQVQIAELLTSAGQGLQVFDGHSLV